MRLRGADLLPWRHGRPADAGVPVAPSPAPAATRAARRRGVDQRAAARLARTCRIARSAHERLVHVGVDASVADRLDERVVVALVLARVRGRERSDSPVELVAGAEIAGDRGGVAAARVRTCECPGAQARVRVQGLHRDPIEVGRRLPVPELADVEVALLTVDAFRAEPAEEDVACGLHEPLTLDHALPLVLVIADARVRGQGRL